LHILYLDFYYLSKYKEKKEGNKMSEKMRKKYKHHEQGDVRIELETPEMGGYFLVNHQNCSEKEKSRMGLVFIYIDGQFHQGEYTEGARLILVYQCAGCGEQ